MRTEIKLPHLGDDAGDEASVSFFYPEVGDHIKEGEDLVEMLTDKAAFNVPSPVSGTLVEFLVRDNDLVKVGQPLAIVDTDN